MIIGVLVLAVKDATSQPNVVLVILALGLISETESVSLVMVTIHTMEKMVVLKCTTANYIFGVEVHHF